MCASRRGGNARLRRDTYQDPHLDVEKGQLQTVEECLLLAVYPIILADVFFQSPSCQLPFLFAKPGCSSWEVREDKESCKSNHSSGEDESQFKVEAEEIWTAYTVIAPSMMKSQRLTVLANSIAHISNHQRTKLEDPLLRPSHL